MSLTVIVTNTDITTGESGFVVKESFDEVYGRLRILDANDRHNLVLHRPNGKRVLYRKDNINFVEER